MRYQANLDSLSKIITNVFIIIALMMLLLHITNVTNTASGFPFYSYILLPVILIAWGLSPQYYEVTDGVIIIKRPFKSITCAHRKDQYNKHHYQG